jgi:hypothetical protein
MRHLKQLRPSPALVISVIALFVSLGGVSWGVATGFIDSREIKNNTIRTADLRNNEVRSGDIRNNTITSRDIRTSTITGGDVKSDTLTGRDILESGLGIVPRAKLADGATAVDGFVRGSTELTDGAADKDLFTLNGFRVFLRCTGASTEVFLQNVSAGDNASSDTDPDFDQGETPSIAAPANGTSAVQMFTAFGSNGAVTGVIGAADGAGSCKANGSATG